MALFAGCSRIFTRHSDKPLSLREFSELISLPLLDSAKDIYYLFHADGLQESELFVRFTVTPGELDAAVNALLADPHSIADSPDLPDLKQFLPMPWWTPNLISNGYYRGQSGRRVINLWADVDKNTVFVCIEN